MNRLKSLFVAVWLTAAGLPLYAAKAPTYPNATKYRDAGAKPATGRSGSAAVEVRALRGKDEADIEVTTGSFDGSASEVGKLDKVQIKLYGSNGDVVVTDNYRKSSLSGGHGVFTYDSPYRGQHVQAQANVSGIDPTRTDVVTVDTDVRLRPDLVADRVQAPVRSYPGTIVTISAVVREQNRDLGARASCVLSIDGIEADRANGVWVDAGDTVTCEFAERFSSVGLKQLAVDVTNVAPADYDTANNRATGQIEIVDPTVPVDYFMTARDTVRTGHDEWRRHEEWQSFDGGPSWVLDGLFSDDYSGRGVDYMAILDFERPITFPALLRSSAISDGATFLSTEATLSVDYTFSDWWHTGSCGSAVQDDRWLKVCTYHGVWNGQERVWSRAETGIQSGTVTYYASGAMTVLYDSGYLDVYSYNYGYENPVGPQPIPQIGNHLEIRASVTDANSNTYDAVAAVDLFPVDINYTAPDYCYSFDWTFDNARYSGYSCQGFSSTVVGREGVAYGVDWK